MLLSIGMMIKNEEKHLRECLKSLIPLLDNIKSELIIIDTGSTDDSVNIAKSFTDKVFYHSWNDNFSEMRNKVLSYCTGEWVMVIDGDEVLQNPNEIINFFKSKDRKNFNTALLMVKNLTDEKDLSNFSLLSSPRLFRNDKDFHYEGAVHNQPIFKSPIIKLDSSLLHYGYISTDKELMERKFMRTVSLLKKELEKDPLNFYNLCQLAVSYSMHEDHEEALNFAIKAYEVLKDTKLNPGDYIYVYMQLAYTYLMLKEYKKAINVCLEGIALKSEILDLHFYLAKAQMMIREYVNAIKSYEEYLKISENIEKFTDTSISLYTYGRYEYACYDLVIAHKEINEYESAFEYCKKIYDEKLIDLNLSNFIYLSLKLKRYDYLYEYYNSNVTRLNLQNDFETFLEDYEKKLSIQERVEVTKRFKDIDGIYGILNKVRWLIFDDKELDFDINDYLESNVDFNNLADYYGDFLYYLILHNKDICKPLNKVRELEFNRFFVYLAAKYKSFGEKVFSYLQEVTFDEEKASYRIKKALERYSILTAELNDKDFLKNFHLFIEDGTTYINKIYAKDTILNEDIYELKNEEEEFLLYMTKANLVKNSDKKSYIGYLRKALKVYPYMRRGIEFLLKEFNENTNTVNNELEQYKIQVKNTIKSLIDNKNFDAASSIISEYEQIIKDDLEILLFKSEIALKEEQSNNENH